MNIGDRLKELRKQRGYSQADVAKLLNIGRTTYLKYENGENKPSRKLKEIASLFHVSTDYLLGRTDDPTPQLVSSADTSVIAAGLESQRRRPHAPWEEPLTAKDERDIQKKSDPYIKLHDLIDQLPPDDVDELLHVATFKHEKHVKGNIDPDDNNNKR